MCCAQRRRRQAIVLARGPRELHRDPELPHAPIWRSLGGDSARAWLADLDDHPARVHQLALERLLELEDRLQAAVVLGAELLPLRARALAEDPLELRVGLRSRRLELRADQVARAPTPSHHARQNFGSSAPSVTQPSAHS